MPEPINGSSLVSDFNPSQTHSYALATDLNDSMTVTSRDVGMYPEFHCNDLAHSKCLANLHNSGEEQLEIFGMDIDGTLVQLNKACSF